MVIESVKVPRPQQELISGVEETQAQIRFLQSLQSALSDQRIITTVRNTPHQPRHAPARPATMPKKVPGPVVSPEDLRINATVARAASVYFREARIPRNGHGNMEIVLTSLQHMGYPYSDTIFTIMTPDGTKPRSITVGGQAKKFLFPPESQLVTQVTQDVRDFSASRLSEAETQLAKMQEGLREYYAGLAEEHGRLSARFRELKGNSNSNKLKALAHLEEQLDARRREMKPPIIYSALGGVARYVPVMQAEDVMGFVRGEYSIRDAMSKYGVRGGTEAHRALKRLLKHSDVLKRVSSVNVQNAMALIRESSRLEESIANAKLHDFSPEVASRFNVYSGFEEMGRVATRLSVLTSQMQTVEPYLPPRPK